MAPCNHRHTLHPPRTDLPTEADLAQREPALVREERRARRAPRPAPAQPGKALVKIVTWSTTPWTLPASRTIAGRPQLHGRIEARKPREHRLIVAIELRESTLAARVLDPGRAPRRACRPVARTASAAAFEGREVPVIRVQGVRRGAALAASCAGVWLAVKPTSEPKCVRCWQRRAGWASIPRTSEAVRAVRDACRGNRRVSKGSTFEV